MTNLSNDKQRSPTVLFKIAAQILLLAALLMGMNNAKAGHFSLSGVNAPATFNSAAHFTISVRFNIIPTVNLFNNAIQVTNGRLIGGPTGVNPRTFTIAPNLNGRDVTVTFPAGLFSSGTHAYASDIVRTVRYERPLATLGDLPANHNGVSPFMVTVTLSKPADDFDINDIELSANASGMLSGSGTDYTLTVMPDNTQGSITINILADGFTDALGVQNTISQGRLVAYGGQPFVALSGAPSSATGLTPFEVTAMFTQDVHRFDSAVGFTLLPIDITSIPVTVTNGMGRVKSHSGRTFVLEITPAGIGDSIDIFLPRNAVIYANFDGNPPSNVVRVPYTDTTPPMVTLGTPATINSLTFQVALNFSEAITRSSFTAVDVMTNINNGMVRVTGVDSNGADIVLIITHDGTVPSIVVSIPGRTFTDQAGNLNLPSSDAVLLYADDIRPDVTLSDLPDSHDGMTPFTVTVTVSEPVTSFVLSDFSAAPSASVTLTGSGTTYTATITPELNNTDDIEILVFESSFADATGNLNRGAQAVRIPYVAPDITPPTVMVRGPAAYESGRSVFIVRLTFSEAVSGVSAGTSPSEARGLKFQVDVDNGSASSAIKISDSIYDVDIVYFGDTTEDISITFLAGVAMDASGNTNTVSNTLVVPSDPPLTVDLATSAQTANAATAFTVTIFFSEDVTDFVLDDIVFNNAQPLTALQMTNASTYVVTVQADNMADVTITIPAGVAMAGTKTNMVSNTVMVSYDHAPTVVLAAAATSMTSPFTVTATFSERVTGFAVDDITIDNGTVATVSAPVAMSDGAVAYTLTITPTAAGDVTLTIPAGAANDLDGTPTANTASNTLTVAYTLDVTPPTVAFIAPAANHDGTSPFTVMVRLSEPSTDFGSISISVSSNANITLSGSGTDYTLTVTPTDTNDIIISVLPGGFTDTIGNANMMASETLTVAYTTGDSTRPTVMLTGPAAYKVGGAANESRYTVRLTFSEDVSGIGVGDLISSGLFSQFGYTNAFPTFTTKISDSIYDVVINYLADVTDGISITFLAGFAMDASGNTNTVSNTLVVPSDGIPPTVVFGDVPANHDGTTPFTVTVTLSEPAEDFIADDIELSNNASGTLSGSGTDYRLTVTPTNTNSITIDIPADSFTDVATNGNTASETVTVTLADTTPPTVTLTGPDPANHDGTSAFMVTVTLSETATDFGAGDIDSSANATVTLTGSGSVYTLTITPTDTGSITIDIPAASFTDAATNPNTASETFTVTYVAPDITPPTVTLTGPDPATFSNTEPFVVTATFDEAVTGFDVFNDSTVTNGTATDGQRLDATTYTLTIMPYDTTGDIEITIPAGVAMDAEGNGNTASDPLTMAYVAPDNIPPAVRLGTQDDTANASDTVLIMAVTFDEPVTGFDAATDIKVTGGTAIAPHRVTSTAYTLTITPTPMTEGTITIQIPANVATDTEGNGNTASNIGRVTYDGIAPTARLSGGGGSTTSFLDYSSVVLASTSSDIDHASFTPDEFVTTPESVVVTSAPNTDGLRVDTVFTITHDGTAEEITITIPIGSFTDLAGNPNTEAVILTTIYTPPDTTPPTVMLSGAPTTVNASDTTFTVTATFSEPVTGFDVAAEVTITNATVTTISAPVIMPGDTTVYTLTITPTTDGTITITIPANVAADAFSNNNMASNTVSVTYDGTPPTVVLTGSGQTFNTLTFTSISIAGTSLDINHASFTSDEWVTTPANVMVTSAPGMNGFRLATVYSIKHDGTASEITITAPIGSFTDNAGNPNTEAFTFTFTYVDVTPPTVTFTDPPANHSNSEFMVTVTLSEPTDDFVISDITFSDNASGALTGSGTDYTLTVTPTDTNSVTITIAGGTFTDAASLPNLFTETLTVAYASDAIRPTVMLTGPTVGNIEPFAVTATFSKPVTGFDAMADITVTNGTATMPVAVSNSETTYTLAITPAGTGDIGVTIPAAAAMDGTGNTNTASETLTVAIDTIRPTAMFSGVPANHDGMTPFTVTVTLSELSNDFGEDDISVANANIALSGSGTDYSLTVTPTGTVTIAIGIATNRFTDAANNGNLLAASVFILYVDTTPPTVTFSGVPASHDGMTPFTLTITLSEPSTDFVVGDIFTTTNVNIALSGSGTDYSLTVTPTSIGSIIISTDANVFTDAANNGNLLASTGVIPYAAPVDTTPLTVTLSGPLTYGPFGFNTEVRFSEDVPGLTIGAEGYTSFTITNAIATFFTRRSGSIYDLSITPVSGSTADISVTFNAGAATAGTKTNTVSNTLTIAHSTSAPVNLIGPDSLTHDGETVFTVEVDFSNDVGGFDTADDITISGGTTSAPVVVGGLGTFSRYALTITPDGTADITISLNSGVAETIPGNTPNAASRVLTVAYAAPADTTPPTVMLTGPASTTELTFEITAVFSEQIIGFTADEVNISAHATVELSGAATMTGGEVHQRLSVTHDGSENSVLIRILAGTLTDTSDNPNTASNLLIVVNAIPADTTPPTVMLTGAPTAVNASTTTFAVTATFSEAVTGFDAIADIAVDNGTAAAPVFVSEGIYTLTITPAGTDGAITITIPANVAADADANGNTASSAVTVTYDTTPPTVTFSGFPTSHDGMTPFMVTVTLSEVATDFVVGDIGFTTNADRTLSGSGTDYIVTVTPRNTSPIGIAILADRFTDAAGNGNTLAAAAPIPYAAPADTTAPTVELTSTNTIVNTRAAFDVTATFSEDVTGFGDATTDVTVTGGTAGTPAAVSGSATTYTITITPDSSTANIEITIPAGAAMDTATTPNGNIISTQAPLTVTYDAEAPTIVLTTGTTTVATRAPFSATAVFSAIVEGLQVTEITVDNGTITEFLSTNYSTPRPGEYWHTYRLKITPTGTGDIRISIPAGVARTQAGNLNAASSSVTVAYTGSEPDPVASVHIGTAGTQVGTIAEAGTTSTTVTVALNPAPTTSVTVNLTRSSTATIATDYSQTGLTDSTDPAYSITVAAGATTASFMLTAVDDSVNDDAEAAVFTVTTGTGYTPASGGAEAVTVTITDNDAPPVASIHIGTAGTQVGTIAEAGTTSTTVTVTLNHASPTFVTVFLHRSGTATIDTDYSQTGLSAAGDSRHIITLAAGATTGSFTLTAVDDSADDDNETAVFTVVTTGSGYTPASGGAAAVTVTIMDDEPTPPTVMLTGAPTAVNASTTTFAVTATFSEPVTGFDAIADIAVDNGTAAAPVFVSEGIYTLTITPAGTDGAITITIPANVAADADANGNTASSAVTVTYDTTPPTATYSGFPASHDGMTPFMVTVTLSEPSSNLVVSDITQTNADRTLSGSGTDYIVAVTPRNTTNPIAIAILADSFTDAAGNGNTAAFATPIPYAAPADTTAPTVELTSTNTIVNTRAAFDVTATFSEDVTGFGDATTDVTVTGGTAGTPAAVSGSATTYTITITPDSSTANIEITIPAGAAMDTATTPNGNIISTQAPLTVTYDTDAPTIVLTTGTTTVATRAPFSATAVFSAIVEGLQVTEITVDNGRITEFLSTNYSVPRHSEYWDTYRLKITPTGTGDIRISIPAGVARTQAGNLNAASSSVTVAYTGPEPDTIRPTVALTAPATANGVATFAVTATFSEDVTGLDTVATDIEVTNGTATIAGSGTTYTLTITPTVTAGTITITIPENVAADAESNGNTASNTVSVTYDATPPVASVHIGTAGTQTGTIAEAGTTSTTVTVALSAAAPPGEITVLLTRSGSATIATDYSHPGLTAAADPLYVITVAAGATTASFMLTAVDDSVDDDAETAVFTVTTGTIGTGYTVAAGGAAAVTVTIMDSDTTRPTVTFSDLPASHDGMTPFTVTVTLSEPSDDFDVTDLQTPNATETLSEGMNTDSGTVVYTLTFTPTTNLDILIATNANQFTDLSGNGNEPSSLATIPYVAPADTPPTVTLTGAPTAVNASVTTFAVTATFSEAVTGFDAIADITVTNGTAAAPVFASAGVYTLIITPAGTDGAITITIPADAATDADGNGNTASSAVTVTYDNAPPTATFTGTDSVSNTDEFRGVILTFDKDIFGLGGDDFMVTNGEFVRLEGVTVNRAFELIIKPDGVGDITITLMAAAVRDIAVGNANIATSHTVTYAPPVASVHIGNAGRQAGALDEARLTATTKVTVALAPAPTTAVTVNLTRSGTATIDTDYTQTGLAVVGGDPTYSIVVAAGATTTFFTLTTLADTETDPAETAVFTVTTGTDYTVATGGAAAATVTILDDSDTTPPTVTFTAPANHNGTSTFTVTVTLSEPATDFGQDDVALSGNASGTLTGSGTVYTLTITPADNNPITIDIAADSFTDAATNANTATSHTVTYTAPADNTPPTVTFTAPASHNGTSTFTVAVTISETATDFVTGDIALSDNASGMLTGSGTDYTLTIIPADNNPITINIAAGSFTDAATNGNTAPETLTVTYDAMADTTPPTATFSGVPASHDGMTPFTLTITLSEPSTDFVVGDFFTTTNVNLAFSGSGTDYSLTVTPTSIGVVAISINPNVFTDASGNGNIGVDSGFIPYVAPADTTPPTVTLTGAPTTANASDTTFTVTATFSEAVTGFDAMADITVTGGTAIAPVAVGNSETTYTLTITPTTDGTITITIPANVAVDAASNDNTASNAVSVTYDSIRPTVVINVATTAITLDTTSPALAIFSESVTGLEASEIQITNGAVSPAGGGAQYILNITPDGSGEDMVITIPEGVVMDAAGNLNTASEPATVLFVAPVVVLSGAPTSVSNTDTFTVTATFTKTVAFSNTAAITIVNGSVTSVTSSSPVSPYTLTIAPDGMGDIEITIPAGIAQSADTGTGNIASETLIVTYTPADTTPPTVTFSGVPASHDGMTPFTLTITLSEPSTDFVEGDISSTLDANIALSGSGTDYSLIVTPIGTGIIAISINQNVFTDAANVGNLQASSGFISYAAPADTTPPTVELTGAPTTANADDTTFTVTATFSEPVTGFDAIADIAVTNGTAIAPVAVGSSETTYTLTITPTTEGEVTITIPANVAVDAASNDNTASNEVSVTYDTTPPEISLTGNGQTTNTLTFVSTIVSGLLVVPSDIDSASFTLDEFVTSPANVMITSAPSMAGLRIGNVLTITHDGTASQITITVPVGSFTDNAGNPNTEASTLTFNYVDNTPPTVELTGAPTTFSNTDAFVVTATFSEPVTGFDAVADITVTNGAATVPVAVSNSETTYTLNITPDGTNGDIEIFIPAAAAMDTATTPNGNTISDTLTVAYAASADTTPPTVELTGAPTTANASDTTFTVTATFSEPVTGFDVAADITVDNGTIAAPEPVGDSGTTYTLTITPTTHGEVIIIIPANVAVDAASNNNMASNTVTVTYDTTPPTVTFTDPPANHSNSEFMVTVTLSEPTDDFVISDITFSDNASGALTGSGTDYTLTVTPTDTNSVTITIAAGTFTDDAINANIFSETLTVTYAAPDNTPPTVARPVPEFSIVEQATSFEVTVTFSEPVTGFDAATDIMVTRGTTLAPVAMGDSGMVYTLAITPAGPSGQIVIIIPAGVAMDASGNLNTASPTLSVTYIRPVTVVLSLAEPQFVSNGRDPFAVTATFSEALGNFDVGDVMVANGTFTASGNGAVYTLTITPTGDTNDAITIQLLEGAGEVGGSGQILPRISDASEVLQVMVLLDNTPPTVELTGAPTTANAGDTTFAVTATFSEAVTGFDAIADIAVTGGTVAAPVAMDSSETTYTLTITPTTDGTITIEIPANAATDASSNNNMASNTVSVTYDGTPPTVTLFSAFPSANGLSFDSIVITFSEPIEPSSFTADDITINHGMVELVNNASTLRITHDGTVSEIVVSIPAGSFTDLAGNLNTAPSSEARVTYDGTPPTVELTGPTTFTEGTFAVTAEFSEVVTGLTVAEITITGASVTISGDGTTYTLTIVPDGTNGDIEISIPASAAVDAATNPNTASEPFTVAYAAPADTTPPTVVLTSATTTLSSNSLFTVTATFSEDVTGFDSAADITVINGFASNANEIPLAPVSVNGSARVYTLTILPNTSGNISISIPANAAMDGAGLGNPASAALIVTYTGMDVRGPNVVLTPSPDSSIGERETRVYLRNSNAVFEVTVTFNEPVRGFGLDDVNIQGGTTSNLMGMDGDAVYTFDLTPSGTGTLRVGLPGFGTGITDLNGNALVDPLSLSVRYDTTPPTVALSAPATANASDTTFAVTAEFSEVVTGFNAADITVTNGAVTVSGSGPIYTLTITPDGNDGPITIAIAASVVTDVAGNANMASTNADSTPSDPVSVTYDGTPPTVTLSGVPATVNVRDPFAVTATFSEPVTGFDAIADIAVTNATVTLAGTGPIYTLTITPDGNDGPITIAIAAGVAEDAASNGNMASNTVSVAYDGTPPTVMLSGAPTTANASTTTFTVTATFDEAVTGFAATEIEVDNGTATLAGSGTTYTLTITPTTDGTITITIPANVAADDASNDNTASNTVSVPYDGTPPAVRLATNFDVLTASTGFQVTVTFDEPVTGFDAVADITVTRATATAPTPVGDDGTIYTTTITPTAAVIGVDGMITITILADAAMDLAGNGNEASTTPLRLTYTPPVAVTLMLADPQFISNGRTPFEVTATFTVGVEGFDVNGIMIDNGTVTVTGSGADYILTITPTGDNNDPITIEIQEGAGVLEGIETSIPIESMASEVLQVMVLLDIIPPTVTLTAPDAATGMTAFTVTATFSEPVTGFDAIADITVTNGTAVAPVAVNNSETDYTLTITPDGMDGEITIIIPADAAMDAASNGNTASATASVTYMADTIPPTARFSNYPANHDGMTSFTVTVILSEPATDFGVSDVTISDNASGTFFGSGTGYRLTITPTDNNPITFDIAAGTFTDAATNPNTAPEPLTVAYAAPADTTPPTVTLSGAPDTVNNNSFAVTATFDESVTGLAAADIAVTNGAATIAGSGSGTTYTLTITPDGTGNIGITIPAAAAMDGASNGNLASNTVTVTYDATVPTVELTGAPTTVNSTATFEVTATFSEPVTGLAAADIAVTNGAATLAGSGANYTLTITPAGTDGEITINIPADVATDTASNGNTASNEVTVTYDGTATTVELTGAPTTVNSTATFAVTATFSEAVTGLTAAEIDITNATVTLAGSGTTYTLTITPDGMDGEITIEIPAAAAVDGANNDNTPSNTVSVTYDATVPTVTLTGAPDTVNSTATFEVTATFSEPVTGLEATEIEVTNGAVTIAGSGTIYTLTITPDGTGNIGITIPAAAAVDAASNGNAASNPVSVTYDGTAPTVALTGAPTTVNASDTTFAVTATFSEPVTGLEAAEIDITNATLTLAGSGTIYTLTITPTTDGTITITIPANVAADAFSNNNMASNTVTVTYDATVPTVALTGAPTTVNSTATFDVTATFSEPVTGFDAIADITVTNGTAIAPVAVNNSETTYTLTITPDGTDGTITITIPAAAAMDAANNGNIASNTLEVEVDNTIVADTKAAITGFMLDRANKLASNQPGLARFLQGTDCGTFSANSTDVSGSVDGCLSNGHTWGEISRTWSSDNAYTLATLGLHGFMRDDLIIGGLVQFDKADDDKRNITGQGWLVGPYFVRKPTDQNMIFEGRLLYGQTDNDISPLGSYTDSFDTERYLAQLRVTGEYGYRIATMMPSLDLTYTEDTQQAYTDTPDNLIGEQGVDLTQLTFGMDFKLPVAIQTGQLDLTGGLSGTYSETNGGESDVEGGRGRTELGLNYSRGSGTTLRLGTFYDGISSDHESFGVNFSLDMKF